MKLLPLYTTLLALSGILGWLLFIGTYQDYKRALARSDYYESRMLDEQIANTELKACVEINISESATEQEKADMIENIYFCLGLI